MAITTEERRFLRSWEEQRKGGKKSYVATYTFGLTFLIFLCCVALGLFLSLPFIRVSWIVIIAISSVVLALLLSVLIWSIQQKKWRRIINRELEQLN
jgi:protein-S-isoprenylcysteine O-methyltransferase Ste14